jgi:hypothetical protein
MSKKNEDLRINKEIILREEDEGAFLFDPNTGRICHLNELGIAIWKLCKKPVTQEQVINAICSQHPEVPRSQVLNDCSRFLKDLKKLGFLSPEAES